MKTKQFPHGYKHAHAGAHANNAVNQGEEKGYFYANAHFPRRGQREGATEGEMNLFKQMNSNEAVQTRRLESLSVVREREREREGPDFPTGKNSAQKVLKGRERKTREGPWRK